MQLFFFNESTGIAFGFIGFVLCISTLRTCLVSRCLTKDALRLIGDLEIMLTIMDESITISSRDSSLSVEWDRMIKFRVVDGFLIFLYKQINDYIYIRRNIV